MSETVIVEIDTDDLPLSQAIDVTAIQKTVKKIADEVALNDDWLTRRIDVIQQEVAHLRAVQQQNTEVAQRVKELTGAAGKKRSNKSILQELKRIRAPSLQLNKVVLSGDDDAVFDARIGGGFHRLGLFVFPEDYSILSVTQGESPSKFYATVCESDRVLLTRTVALDVLAGTNIVAAKWNVGSHFVKSHQVVNLHSFSVHHDINTDCCNMSWTRKDGIRCPEIGDLIAYKAVLATNQLVCALRNGICITSLTNTAQINWTKYPFDHRPNRYKFHLAEDGSFIHENAMFVKGKKTHEFPSNVTIIGWAGKRIFFLDATRAPYWVNQSKPDEKHAIPLPKIDGVMSESRVYLADGRKLFLYEV
jgi:hypothetical protein